MKGVRKELSASGLLTRVRQRFMKVSGVEKRSSDYTLTDCLMSGVAIFGLKYPSLLQFDKTKHEDYTRHNLGTLYGVSKVPCDTQLRERLDDVDPSELSGAFNTVFSALQRGKELEDYVFYQGYYLVPLDATGFFSSQEIHCAACCEKHHRNGSTTYYHQMLSTVIVHPAYKEVFPFAPEAIIQQDGKQKNDCERNAAKRLLPRLRTEHPHLKMIIVGDGLYSNGPFIRLLNSLSMRYILSAKPDDHKYLLEFFNLAKKTIHEVTDAKGTRHHYEFHNGLPLNDAQADLLVNVIDYTETLVDGTVQHFTWVTDFTLTTDNVATLTKGGRARWKIENETFNTLKNQGYQFEHNFGHGYKHLSNVFAHLMMLAFFIDQVQQRCCYLFQAALAKKGARNRLWAAVRGLTSHYFVDSWEDLFSAIAFGYQGAQLIPNTS